MIKIDEIYNQNINFLIGAGASYGLFPTLALKLETEGDEKHTIETLAALFDKTKEEKLKTLLFKYYYKECIEPISILNIQELDGDKRRVIDNYEAFLRTILMILNRRSHGDTKNCNIFTTNYDGCMELTADILLSDNSYQFIINDGSRGFKKRFLHAKNFHSTVYETGVFHKHRTEIPQINLIHLHGSVYWKKINDSSIEVDFAKQPCTVNQDFIDDIFGDFDEFSKIMKQEGKTVEDLRDLNLSDLNDDDHEFWREYSLLPIVNPTKWKFHETVFEEHYYQMLRFLSYELEKPNSVFITFGFSFADEHILNLVKRSLSNPSLKLYICCFNRAEKQRISALFDPSKKIEFISLDSNLDFTRFNQEIFSLNPKKGTENVN